MPNPRLEYALSLMGPGDWEKFELYAAEFFAVEFPELRTMAAASGDKGRDGEAFIIDSEPTTAFQYSVTVAWEAKIKATVARLRETKPHVNHLIYATNQSIGPAADDLRISLAEDRLRLDVRDRSYFVERELTAPQRTVASAELIEAYVDPMLSKRGVIETTGSVLSADEGRVALLHLALDDADQNSERGLTKSCFDSLVLAVLHDTSATSLMSEAEVRSAVAVRVPTGSAGQVDALVTSALTRLSRKNGAVKYRSDHQKFHLSHEESLRLKDKTARFLLEEIAVEGDLEQAIAAGDPDGVLLTAEGRPAAAKQLREILERLLFQRGEDFARAVDNGDSYQLDAASMFEEIAAFDLPLPLPIENVVSALLTVMSRPEAGAQEHLARIANAYTLFAFLRQTPDVQRVVLRIFSEGNIWLDTSAILPLIAETLIDEERERRFTILLAAARDAGLKLHVTEGVVEEVERHLNRAVAFTYVPAGEWIGRAPFIYSSFVLSGRAPEKFVEWQRDICGRERPLQDVADYLRDEFRIEVQNLLELSDSAPIELRAAVQELWNEAHERRRSSWEGEMDSTTMSRLVAHDVENTVGVIQHRRLSGDSPMGYRSWWLSLDRTAMNLTSWLKTQLGASAPASPVLSADFLTQLLSLGPMRSALERDVRASLPLLTDITLMENIPLDLIEEARKARSESTSSNERVIRREVRDRLDRLRQRKGPEALGGLERVNERIRAANQRSKT